MSEKPRIAAELVASITAAVPRRLIGKLDAEPRLAESWAWQREGESWQVLIASGGETVRLEAVGGLLENAGQVSCSCLLSPRCLHVLATVTLLEVAAGVTPPEEEAGPAEEPVEIELEPAQREAVALAGKAAAEVLEAGAAAAGAVLQADLLRAAHHGRATGLHRLSRAALRLVTAIRDLRAQHPAFTLTGLADDLEALLLSAHQLGQGRASRELLGRARRNYEEVGALRLFGLCCEAVVAPGFAGVSSLLIGADGRMFSAQEVLPAEAIRAVNAYDATVRLGESGLSHRQLCREGLFVSGATVSADGRLGAGEGVKAVRSGPATWRQIAHRWDEDLDSQLTRAWAGGENEGASLLFLAGQVVGAEPAALVMALDAPTRRVRGPLPNIRLVAASDHEELAYRENLRQLACLPGLRFGFVGRLVPNRPRTVVPLALFELPQEEMETGSPRLQLPEAWLGRCNLGLDRLQRGHFSQLAAAPSRVELADPRFPLEDLRRRLERFALGGRSTLPVSTFKVLEEEARYLEKSLMPNGAACLRHLAQEANRAERGISGVRRAGNSRELAKAWLAARRYERAASRRLLQASWR